jgi:hypothetical protein
MKKLLVLAMMATLLMAGSAFAVNRHLAPTPDATFAFGAGGVAAGPSTTNNDDSCDIGVAPAATLLLPYFEVDTVNRTQDTLFTITNVSRFPQIAKVTVWTDWSFPVLDFNIFLTGYDVQGISLNQLIGQGIVAQNAGTGPTSAQSPLGSLSAAYNSNPNLNLANCGNLPGALNPAILALARTALITGVYGNSTTGCGTAVGSNHANGNAIGYITVDTVAACTTTLPNQSSYYSNEILFDNVLIGDYQQLGPAPAGTTAASFDAGGNAMVHIRAVPEGGPAGVPLAGAQTNLPYTFYDRYTPTANRTLDRRQPLPALWAARYIQGGTGAFATNYKIWREGFGSGTCGTVAQNGTLPVAEIVRFDEHENPSTSAPCQQSPCPPSTQSSFPETSSNNTASGNFPTISGADVGGWMYLNLNNGGSTGYSVTRNVGGVPTVITGNGSTSNLAPAGSGTVGPRPSQNWVIVEMFGNAGANRLTVDFDAAWLGNGCSPAVGPGATIGPAGGVLVCPAGDPGCTPGVGAYTGTNTTPLP